MRLTIAVVSPGLRGQAPVWRCVRADIQQRTEELELQTVSPAQPSPAQPAHTAGSHRTIFTQRLETAGAGPTHWHQHQHQVARHQLALLITADTDAEDDGDGDANHPHLCAQVAAVTVAGRHG